MLAAALVWLLVVRPSCSTRDNFALLGTTLKTMQRAACDNEVVSLACPPKTTISIQGAKYGQANGNRSCTGHMKFEQVGEDQNCLWPNAMQYSLLQKVVETCQKKPQCKFSTKPKPSLQDPCPSTRKFVEVAYWCKPYEFKTSITCHDDVISLSCRPNLRVAVLEAKYGRIAYEANTCPQAHGVRDENCAAPYATETVMQVCHGKRRCSVSANSKTFGAPCMPNSRPYLKVTHTCVPLGILMERYESASEIDEVQSNKELTKDETGSESDRWETNIVSPVADPALQPIPEDEFSLYGNVKASSTMRSNVEKKRSTESPKSNWTVIVSVSIAIAGVLVIIGILLAIHCYINHRSTGSSKTGDMFTIESPNPNVFLDAVSDIDNDVEVSHISGTFYDPVHPDMILFRDVPGSKGTLRAMRPLSTIYPSGGISMYGSDFVPSAPARELGPRTFSTEDPPCPRPEVMSPRSLSEYSNSHNRYG